ncbi:MAG: hypothetical protein AB1457_13275 [Chloroflexota bacterium]|nr:MAG: hypothetical protein KatS3mg045_0776 [Bellilinea sp.]
MKTRTFAIGLLAFLLAACGSNATLNMQDEKIWQAAETISVFQPPAGFDPEVAVEFKEYTLVSFSGNSPQSHLYLIQSQDEQDETKLAGVLNDLLPGMSNFKQRTTVLENRPVILRGEQSTLIISEGTNGDQIRYRQAMVPFAGKGGPALLVYSEPLSRWNEDTLHALLTSFE